MKNQKRWEFRPEDMYKLSKEDSEKSNKIFTRLRELGIPGIVLDGQQYLYTEDESEALKFIFSNKEIPIDLKDRLISTIELRNANRKTSKFSEITEDDLDNIMDKIDRL